MMIFNSDREPECLFHISLPNRVVFRSIIHAVTRLSRLTVFLTFTEPWPCVQFWTDTTRAHPYIEWIKRIIPAAASATTTSPVDIKCV